METQLIKRREDKCLFIMAVQSLISRRFHLLWELNCHRLQEQAMPIEWITRIKLQWHLWGMDQQARVISIVLWILLPHWNHKLYSFAGITDMLLVCLASISTEVMELLQGESDMELMHLELMEMMLSCL